MWHGAQDPGRVRYQQNAYYYIELMVYLEVILGLASRLGQEFKSSEAKN